MFAQPFGETHGFAQAINDRELAVAQGRDHHVKTIGTEIDSRDNIDAIVVNRGSAVGCVDSRAVQFSRHPVTKPSAKPTPLMPHDIKPKTMTRSRRWFAHSDYE